MFFVIVTSGYNLHISRDTFMKKMNVLLASAYSLLTHPKILAAIVLIQTLAVTMPPGK